MSTRTKVTFCGEAAVEIAALMSPLDIQKAVWRAANRVLADYVQARNREQSEQPPPTDWSIEQAEAILLHSKFGAVREKVSAAGIIGQQLLEAIGV